MNSSVNVEGFRLRAAAFAPDTDRVARFLAMYSAAIALADDTSQTSLIHAMRPHGTPRAAPYEIVLQSYLFLGFPRMLAAAELLDRLYKDQKRPSPSPAVTAGETADWYERGVELCRRVYDGNYDRLRDRVESFAPEIFRWMVFEGYGKVLSRPGVGIVDRELAIIACLMMENRPPQLYSHVKGALNVGCAPGLIKQVIGDVGDSAGDGYTAALDVCSRLGIQ